MAENLKVHTGVSPALHPEILSHRAPALTGRTAGAFTAAQQTLSALYKNQSLILNAREAEFSKQRTPANLAHLQKVREGKARPGPNMVMIGAKVELALPPSDAKIFNDAAELAFRRGAAIFDSSRKKIVTELETLHAERAGRASDPAANSPKGLAMAAELRAHLKGLPNAERVALIREQIAAGNARLADAVCSAESFLSGLDPKTHANLVAETHKQFAPEETTKIENLVAVLKSVDDACSIAVRAYGDALVPVVGLDAAANAALSALKTGGE
jgi:hypothetical protein